MTRTDMPTLEQYLRAVACSRGFAAGRLLGKGDFGHVFKGGEGRVVKVTFDGAEFGGFLKLRGTPECVSLPMFPELFSLEHHQLGVDSRRFFRDLLFEVMPDAVDDLGDALFIIEREDVGDLRTDLASELDALFEGNPQKGMHDSVYSVLRQLKIVHKHLGEPSDAPSANWGWRPTTGALVLRDFQGFGCGPQLACRPDASKFACCRRTA